MVCVCVCVYVCMYVPSWGGVFVSAGYTVLKLKIGLLEQGYKEHIRYTTSNNSQSAYALHILHTKHEYGPMNSTISLLHPVHKSGQMNSSENFYIHLLQWHNTVINEQSEKHENHLFDLIYNIQIKHACTGPASTFSHPMFDFSTA